MDITATLFQYKMKNKWLLHKYVQKQIRGFIWPSLYNEMTNWVLFLRVEIMISKILNTMGQVFL